MSGHQRCDVCHQSRGRRRWRSVRVLGSWQLQLLLCWDCLEKPTPLLAEIALYHMAAERGREVVVKPAV